MNLGDKEMTNVVLVRHEGDFSCSGYLFETPVDLKKGLSLIHIFYANTGKPLNKAAALYIVSYINCVLKSTVRTDPESFSVQGGST